MNTKIRNQIVEFVPIDSEPLDLLLNTIEENCEPAETRAPIRKGIELLLRRGQAVRASGAPFLTLDLLLCRHRASGIAYKS